ncbi:hypothetical protein A1O3_09096 [Capronia epimyces CBS 606.96]|uniref:3-oxoacyl-[acyl-carrier protein] reductase n=1 Tax=Capronia epimyces CBS 606.96 TaxID=1182542 RepID=W9XBU1_9EURO|nr:uncharacterized protein A1O3_09096 [Capronia epimyces CBS 606.96]EXJ77937.1 hypothetical protein A1O3_09096 [Capronia epimyces CBS 606.96]
MDFPGVAFITGAASGIGRATSLLFAAEGCQRIVISDINEAGLEETKALIAESHGGAGAGAGPDVLAVPVDLRSESSVDSLVEKAVARFGRLDYCCNVAGIVLGGGTAEVQTSDFELQYEVNLRGVFFCERAELRVLRQQEPLASKDSKYPIRGAIVNVSSLAGQMAYADLPAYSAFKHGVCGLSKSDAMKYGPEGIRINTVCPGAVTTPITKNLPPQKPEELEALLKIIALGRYADPEELAQAIVWLSSGRASYINGTTLSVNGGRQGF